MWQPKQTLDIEIHWIPGAPSCSALLNNKILDLQSYCLKSPGLEALWTKHACMGLCVRWWNIWVVPMKKKQWLFSYRLWPAETVTHSTVYTKQSQPGDTCEAAALTQDVQKYKEDPQRTMIELWSWLSDQHNWPERSMACRDSFTEVANVDPELVWGGQCLAMITERYVINMNITK